MVLWMGNSEKVSVPYTAILDLDVEGDNVYYVTLDRDQADEFDDYINENQNIDVTMQICRLNLSTKKEEVIWTQIDPIFNISVNGSKLVFAEGQYRKGEIYLLDLDILSVERITDNEYFDGQ